MRRILPPQRPIRPRSRRSQRRLGAKHAKTGMESRVSRSPLAFEPALVFWKVNGSRIVGIMVLGLCLWITYLLFEYDSFYVYGAEITGNRILSTQEIYGASEIDSLSVFWVNPNTVKANIEALPNVKTAKVKIKLPASVIITVEERQPEVVWQTGNSMWWIDNEGTFVPPREDVLENETRLRIIDNDGRHVRANDKVDLSIIRGAQIVNAHKPEVTELLYTETFGLMYITEEGWPIYLGKTVNLPAKLMVADAIRGDLLARNVQPAFIDVRNPMRVVYEELQGNF